MADNDFESLKDLTDVVTIEGSAPEPGKTTTDKTAKGTGTLPVPAPVQEDHPGIALLDIAIEESVRYCEKEGFPAPNLSLWHNFSRGFLNKSLWHYFPSGAEPESPAICALIGVAGLAVCYTPVIIAFYEKKQKEGKNAEQKKIDADFRKTAELRAARRARGEDPNTGKPLTSPPPGYMQDEQEAEEEEGGDINEHPPENVAPKVPDWFLTTAQPIKTPTRTITPEPPAPGMS